MREYALVFLVAAAVTYLLTVVAREIALRTGAVAAVRDRDVHAEPIPYLGGLAMLGGLVAAYLVAQELPFLSSSGPFVFRDAGIVIIAGAMICAVGVLDDLFELDALTKLGGQVLAAGFLIFSGIQYTFFPTQDDGQFSLDPAQGALLTVLIVVATVNAVNFVDGLDGLAAGVVGIGATAFFLFCYQLANLNGVSLATTGALLSASLAGACAGFLPHNFHPARLFMGDSGSMLIGLVLSASAVTLSGQFSGSEITQGAGGSQAEPAAHPAAGAAPRLDPDRPDHRPAARCRTTYPCRPVALRAGQAAPPPPAARDRALAATGGVHHVDVGRPGRLRDRAREPLHGALDVDLAGRDDPAHDHPHLRPAKGPQAPAPGARGVLIPASGNPVSDASGLCASFHKHPKKRPRQDGRRHDDRAPQAHLRAPRDPLDPSVRGPEPLW